jgi:uncharacterized protein YecT (DUF1311 family)
MKIKILFLCLAFSAFLPVQGAEDKDPIEIEMDTAMEQNGSTGGQVDAITEANQKWETKLNSLYKTLKQKMQPDEFAALQQAQRSWITYRDKQLLSYESTYGKMDGSMWVPMHAYAVMNLTKKRVQELQTLLGLVEER